MSDAGKSDDIAYMHTARLSGEAAVDYRNEEEITKSQRDDAASSDDDGRPILTPLPIYDKPIQKDGKYQSFTEVLDDILKEDTKCPEVSNVGPKPWLHRQVLPKPKGKYYVSQEPFIYKPKKKDSQPTPPFTESPALKKSTEPVEPRGVATDFDSMRRSRPPSNGSVGFPLNDGKQSQVDSPQNDNDAPSPSINASRLPSGDELEGETRIVATEALRSLSLAKAGLDRDKDAEHSKHLYDVPCRSDVTDDDASKRKIISVPAFHPPPDPVRNDKGHPMSSEPLYDVDRSAIPTPANVSQGALDLMYQLFGKDLTGDNPFHDQNARPGSTISVTADEARGKRAPSRAGSICSEWSECTIPIPDYPESEASTLPTTTIDFSEIPQVGLPPTHPDDFHPTPQHLPNFVPYFPEYDTPHRYPLQSSHPQTMSQPNGPGYFPLDPPNANRYGGETGPWPSAHHLHPHWGTFSPVGYRHSHFPPRMPHPPTRHPPPRLGHKSRSPARTRSRVSSNSEDETYFSRSPSPITNRRHRDDYDIIGKSFIDGYKAAMKDAIKTFAENQLLKANVNPKESEEEKMHRTLRRALTSGRINDLPDNVELGDIRKAFSRKDDNVTMEDFLIPDTGRPLSRRNSLRQRHSDRDIIDDVTFDDEHVHSCDCSECEEEMEARNSFHEGEVRRRREARKNDVAERAVESEYDSRVNQMRQRYMETMESSGLARGPPSADGLQRPIQWQSFHEGVGDGYRRDLQNQRNNPKKQSLRRKSESERQKRVKFGLGG